ncbi:MlaA family lipoprotein [Sphingomonas oligophenolica]|uniref:VacJ family lipoprotein n=1 Tax=Sphingomonas oligophenolica TaxID=301154 RepID=A0A502CPF8_9SPHN|nr:VacJ family lipoprotein [Sphingomonas oligophenolica]TPG13686.1 VacJ family lipoprotein [Sphingomonas oligophenolica]
MSIVAVGAAMLIANAYQPLVIVGIDPAPPPIAPLPIAAPPREAQASAAAEGMAAEVEPQTAPGERAAAAVPRPPITIPAPTPPSAPATMDADPPITIQPPTPPPVPLTMYADPPAQQALAPVSDGEPSMIQGAQADIVVVGRAGHPPGDPLEAINEQSFALTQKADTAVVGPISRVYRSIAPQPLRDGLRNVFRNLHEPDNFLNFVLQHKIGKAAETVARFAINSTLGVLGLFDIARRKPFKLKPRTNSLSNTLGFYGVGPGPFFFLPLIGPTTLRDALGNAVDGLVLPTAVGKPFTGTTYTVPSSAFRSLDHRVRIDDKLKDIKAAPNPYAAARTYYLARRQAEIDQLRGRNTPKADGNTLPGGTPPPATDSEGGGTPP